ncbi:helix-turn-helix domain-containing protein [Jhaorihella thermophila]
MFGANLRELSRQYPSISELTRQLGINRTQFNRYLSGESFPRPDVLDRICTFFGVDARILLEPVGEIETPNAALSNPFLKDFLGEGINTLTEDQFPSGFYRFFRQSFLNADRFITGLVFVFFAKAARPMSAAMNRKAVCGFRVCPRLRRRANSGASSCGSRMAWP